MPGLAELSHPDVTGLTGAGLVVAARLFWPRQCNADPVVADETSQNDAVQYLATSQPVTHLCMSYARLADLLHRASVVHIDDLTRNGIGRPSARRLSMPV